MTLADADGHVLGNFHAYYSFNPVGERLRFMDAATSRAVRAALLALESNSEVTEGTSTTMLDVGCNEGDLTLGFYHALSGNNNSSSSSTQPVEQRSGGGTADVPMNDVPSFDAGSTSALNDLAQKQKRHVEFVVRDVGGSSSHRKLFACDVRVDGASVGRGEGVSKKVAKAKAADAALRVLRDQETSEKDADAIPVLTKADSSTPAPDDASQADMTAQHVAEATSDRLSESRKKLWVLGVDIDQVLIDRASRKAEVVAAAGDAVQFCCADVSEPAFDDAVRSFLARATRAPSQRPFELVTCFSVTMWIHLNKGDNGLWTFLERMSDMASHLIIEPQPWKCYRYGIYGITVNRFDNVVELSDACVEYTVNGVVTEPPRGRTHTGTRRSG